MCKGSICPLQVYVHTRVQKLLLGKLKIRRGFSSVITGGMNKKNAFVRIDPVMPFPYRMTVDSASPSSKGTPRVELRSRVHLK